MEGNEVGLQEALQKVTDLREFVGAADIVVHWSTDFGDVMLILDEDGHDFFVNDEHVPQHEAG